MDKPIMGQDILYIIQAVDAALGSDPLLPAYQTDGSFSSENELFDEVTKNGRILGYGTDAESFEITYYGKQGDEGQRTIEDAYKNKKQLKIWRVDRNKNANDKHDAQFAYVLIESREYSDGSEGAIEISVTLQVFGAVKDGEIDTLPEIILNAKNGGYDFQQPGATTGESPGQTTP